MTTAESGFSSVRIFMMRQKRKINVILSFVVIAALIIGLYTISYKPLNSAVDVQAMEHGSTGRDTPEDNSKNSEIASSNEDKTNEATNKEETISKKEFESADRLEWKAAEAKYEETVNKHVDDEEDDEDEEEDEEDENEDTKKHEVEVKKPATTRSPPAAKEESADTKTPKKIKLIRKIPEVIIIGVHKCNTKFLADVLHEHPQISVAWGSDYFNVDSNYKKGTSWYLEHLPEVPNDRLLIERSSRYYCSMKAAERIKNLNNKTKIIFMACDPVKRAIGHYRAQKVDDENLDPFENLAIHPVKKDINEDHDFIVDSIYNKHIQAWLEYFPKEQLFILDDVSLMHDTDNELRQVEDFLGVSHSVSNNQIYYNATRGTRCGHFEHGTVCFGIDRAQRPQVKHEPIDPKVVAQLKNYFRNHNDDFFKRVGRKFEW